MKVRIVEKANGYVYVEIKRHFFYDWSAVESFFGDGAWDEARKYADHLLNPKIEYIGEDANTMQAAWSTQLKSAVERGIRDDLAKAAMAACMPLFISSNTRPTCMDIAANAYRLADAMLEARK